MNGMGVLAPLLVGFAFGWVLQKGKLGRYETIVNVFRFTDLTVVKFLVSALMVGMLGIQALVSLGLAEDIPIPSSHLVGNLLGGLVFVHERCWVGHERCWVHRFVHGGRTNVDFWRDVWRPGRRTPTLAAADTPALMHRKKLQPI